MKFRATILTAGKTATGIEVPARVVEGLGSVPADFAAALDGDAEARRAFEAMPYSHKLQHLLAIEAAKAAATRERRIAKAIVMLRDGKR